MPYRRLFLLVEGSDDERFAKNVLLAIFNEQYDTVQIVKYSGKSPKKKRQFINSIMSMRADYLYLSDINSNPCITTKKTQVQNKVNNIKLDRIRVVITEIESWYFAGLKNDAAKDLGIDIIPDSNTLTKETFNRLIPRHFDSRIDFMIEILKRYSRDTAKHNNKSFKYLAEKDLNI